MDKINWEILVDHLNGVASESEEKLLAEWIAEDEEHCAIYDRLKKIWLAGGVPPRRPDTEKALAKVLATIRTPEGERATSVLPRSSAPKRSIVLPFIRNAYVLRAAAAVVTLVGALYLYTLITSKSSVDQTSITFSNMQSLRLPDGTKITFDGGSSFSYPKNFQDEGTREVYLRGEAYFEVARNEKHPFVVHANRGKIKVLGTKFNIRAWGSYQPVVVAVQEGKVAFQSESNGNEKDIVVLVEHTMSKLLKGASPSPPEFADISRYLSWMKREAYFQDTPVPEVLSQLERWYHVTIQSTDSAFLKSNITVFIENKPLTENLRLISVTMNVRFEQEGEIVRFLPN